VATFMGLLLAAAWPLGLMAIATWLIVAVLFRMSSFAALVAALASPLLALLPLPLAGLPASGPVLALAVASAFLIWLRHHENIARILKGTEPRIGAKAR
jgi:glycerol-3-phosphate acyltransferase PlsY